MYENLLKIVTNLGSPKVLLVGDFMLDGYIYGDALRISPEAPVPVLKISRTQQSCGGAGAVAAALAALGARPICFGAIGDDANGRVLCELLTAIGADISGLLAVKDRPTTSKQRLIGLAQHRHRQQLIRMDQESDGDLSAETYEKVLQLYKSRLPQADIVCLQDYDKGLLTVEFTEKLIKSAVQADKRILIDPSPDCDYSKYSGSTVITPNRRESSKAVGFEVENEQTARLAAEQLKERLNLNAVVITLDKEGAYLITDRISRLIPTRARNVYDVTAAGDMVLATLAVTLAADCDYKTAVQLSNIAGGLEVEKFGSATVTVAEIINEILGHHLGGNGKLRTADSLAEELNWHRMRKKTVVFTNGCFDVLHRGHVEFLKFCKSEGDIVVVAVNSDKSVRAIKGPGRPINNQNDRTTILAAMETVDYVTVFDEPDPLEVIKKLRPDVLVKGKDWAEKGVVGRQFVESYGGKVVLAELVDGKSTTATIEKLKNSIEQPDGE